MYALANMLKTPIIIYADKLLHDASPISLAGIYLAPFVPLEECDRSPVLIAYHDNHFATLKSSDENSPDVYVPLKNIENELLPLQYFYEVSDSDEQLKLLDQYLDIKNVHADVEGRNTANTNDRIIKFNCVFNWKR